MTKPACMGTTEYTRWLRSNRALPKSGQAVSVCSDCLPTFSAEMRDEDRCDGVPTGHLYDSDTIPTREDNLRLAVDAAREGKRRRRAPYVQRAGELRQAGLTYAQIAKEMGVALTTASRYVYDAEHD